MGDKLARQLSKLGNVGKGISDSVGHDTSGQGLTGVDIAAALSLAKVTRVEELMIRYIYVHDYGVYEEMVRAIHLAAFEKWRESWNWRMTPFLFLRLTDAAIIESLEPRICITCKGVGSFQLSDAQPFVDCQTCNGVGRIKLTDKERARRCGVKADNFRHQLASRYVKLLSFVQAVPQSGERKILKALRMGGGR